MVNKQEILYIFHAVTWTQFYATMLDLCVNPALD